MPTGAAITPALAALTRAEDGIWVGGSTQPCPENPEHQENPECQESPDLPVRPVLLAESAACIEPDGLGLTRGTLWPLYHDDPSSLSFSQQWWTAYREVNTRFAEAAAAVADTQATVWIHGLQLQLVPKLLRQLLPDLTIGFSLHVPFPGLPTFSQLPWREEMLGGLLAADVLGFHRQSDRMNFADVAAALAPVADLQASSLPSLRSAPTSIDAATTAAVADAVADRGDHLRLRSHLGDPGVLLLSVDRLDPTCGVMHRLHAISSLFEDGRLDPGTVGFLQVVIPPRTPDAVGERLREDIERYIGHINGRFAGLGRPVVMYQHRDVPDEKLIGLCLAADVYLSTPLREGMGLGAETYVTARRGRGGAVVVSEFDGVADVLDGAVVVNPHDTPGLADAIMTAMTLDPHDAALRIDAMAEAVASDESQRWAETFLETLRGTVLRGAGSCGADLRGRS
ncbi:alpha,alpha-trehalose-phosphate synthase (UDP-forming) [Brevibacterium atlanticum]|uniref:alpha,alpha-trehalose-phosphate synthase (UDP-forming) n=1 Tax=Brevibacterium atlanticum TaxID=2697563 RepID=UPI00141E286D|nr:trehalose-6-phosphate synthase [Brevibacterium atlanticum]